MPRLPARRRGGSSERRPDRRRAVTIDDYARVVISRVRVLARTAVLAAALAVLGFGAAGYGVFGALPATSAILETTAQSPVSVVPRPSPALDRSSATATARVSAASPWLVVAIVGGIVIAATLARRRLRPPDPR
jgi:hypothetical protein